MFKKSLFLLPLPCPASHAPAEARSNSAGVRVETSAAQRRHPRRVRWKARTPPKEPAELIERLRAAGAKAERGARVSQPLFSVGGYVLAVKGEEVRVFVYPTAGAAEHEAGRVSPDGWGAWTSKVSWMAAPHFFRSNNLIVLYAGDDAAVLRALGAVLGAQFAGGGGSE